MSHHPVHYELFSRRTPQSAWVLEMASEVREQVIEAAEDLLTGGRAAIRVCKETLDRETGEYRSLTVLEKGIATPVKKLKLAPDTDTICTSPQDLYTPLAREKVSRLLEDWLAKQQVTPFELLHRPDLAEKLEASGSELLHVRQKLSVPESHETGQDLHDLMRRWDALFDRACTRLIQDGRKNLFPAITTETCVAVATKLNAHPERAYVLGGAIAAALKPHRRPSEKLYLLLGFAQAFAAVAETCPWPLAVVEAPVVEIFAARNSLNDVLGQDLDLGDSMAVMTRMAAGDEVNRIAAGDSHVANLMLPLDGVLGGYHDLIRDGHLPHLAVSISRRLMQELKGPRRLKPGNAIGEIDALRVLTLCMTAAGRDEAQRDDIRDAFAERSKKLVSADFVDSLLQSADHPADEVDKLIWLCENMVGAANKRQAARWLSQIAGGAKFERHMREGTQSPAQRLQVLARMQGRVRAAGLIDQDGLDIGHKLGLIGSQIATEAKLLAHILRGAASPMQKFSLLLSFACGQSAPLGVFADQAKAEVMKMLRDPVVRSGVTSQPHLIPLLKPLMQAA